MRTFLLPIQSAATSSNRRQIVSRRTNAARLSSSLVASDTPLIADAYSATRPVWRCNSRFHPLKQFAQRGADVAPNNVIKPTFSVPPHRSHIGASQLVLLFGWLLMAPVVHAQAPQQFDSLIAFDGNGKRVGPIDAASEVVLQFNEQFVAVQIGIDGFGSGAPNLINQVRFESPNCAGQGYTDRRAMEPPLPLIQPGAVGTPGHSVYVFSTTDTTRRDIMQQSEVEILPDARGCLNIQLPVKDVVPVAKIAELDLYFTTPFSIVPLQGCCGDCNGGGSVTIDEVLTTVNNALGTCPIP